MQESLRSYSDSSQRITHVVFFGSISKRLGMQKVSECMKKFMDELVKEKLSE